MTTPTTTTKATPRPLVDYIHEVLNGRLDNKEAAHQCEDKCGRLWSLDLLDMDVKNVSDILEMTGLNETWTNYQLYVSPWIVSTGLTFGIHTFVENVTMTPAEPYHCATQCQAFPKFVLLANICYCLLSGTNSQRYYNQTTAVVYDTLQYFSMDANELIEANKQCVIGVMNFKIFPITYTLQQAPCDGTHSVICQEVQDKTIRYRFIYLENGTYSEAAEACFNYSMTVFNPFNFDPSLFATLLNSTDVVTVWTAVTREFYWWARTEEVVKYKRPYCRLLGINGTLSSQPCSSKKSSLCFIDRNQEKRCSLGSSSSSTPPSITPSITSSITSISIDTSHPKDSKTTEFSISETPKASISTIINTTLNRNKSDKTNMDASKSNSSDRVGLYIGVGVAVLFVSLTLVIAVIIFIKRRKSHKENNHSIEMNAVSNDNGGVHSYRGITGSRTTLRYTGTPALSNNLLTKSEDDLLINNGFRHESSYSSTTSNAPETQNEPPTYSIVNKMGRQNKETENGNIDNFPTFSKTKMIHSNTFRKNHVENTPL